MEEITESAKAVQEVAKTTGQSIKFLQGVSDWFGEVVGEPIKQASGMFLTDAIKAERLKRAIFDEARLAALARKVNAIHEGVPVTPRLLEPKMVIPLLESATMEFEEDLHTLWAKLLASAMDGNAPQVDKFAVSILSQLTSEDAVVLEKYWTEWSSKNSENTKEKPNIIYGAGCDNSNPAITAKFIALGLVEPSYIEIYAPKKMATVVHSDLIQTATDKVKLLGTSEVVAFTPLGESFCASIGLPIASVK